ncbi:hypothetical protein PtA15_17A288 [Puccinia triticina]|uniref:Uncharacterized protein n=2 Tax=Puccinia triticina TaxID=208348 RepID=A0ABY7D610_9BASI|nr:uncharacterized protein PtA15_17A288 [Puccinia triticina]WAQ92806.1 hypothetical protein PtA15_17A288 [Puccinia triticina]
MVQVGRLQKDWLIEKKEKAAEKGLDCCFCKKREKKNKPYYIDNGPDRRGHYDSTGDALIYYQMGRMDGERANQPSDPAPPPVLTNPPSGATPSSIPSSEPPESSADPGCCSGVCTEPLISTSSSPDPDTCFQCLPSADKVAEGLTSTLTQCSEVMPSPEAILSLCVESKDFLGKIIWEVLNIPWQIIKDSGECACGCCCGLIECCLNIDCE